MELKTKIETYLSLLDSDKDEITKSFLKWMEFFKITKEEMDLSYIEGYFNKVLIKIRKIENALTGDLEDNYDNFLEFFMIAVDGGTECHKDIQDLISNMNLEDEEGLDEEGLDEEEVSLGKFVNLADKIHLIKFKKTVYKFYFDMSDILDDVFDYADKLYIHHTDDVTLCGTRNL